MQPMTKNNFPLIHIACINDSDSPKKYLFLRKTADDLYNWFEEMNSKEEKQTSVTGQTIEEAIRKARRHWKNASFRSIICGFRYTLPERDEHGINALFSQMVVSYSSPNGIYLDSELGHPCIVQNASQEARELWKRLTVENKL
jgi:hypothetical protein